MYPFSPTRHRAYHLLEVQVPDSALTITEQLLELDMGEWEGGERSVCYSPANLEIITKDVWRFAPPGGESQQQVGLGREGWA